MNHELLHFMQAADQNHLDLIRYSAGNWPTVHI